MAFDSNRFPRLQQRTNIGRLSWQVSLTLLTSSAGSRRTIDLWRSIFPLSLSIQSPAPVTHILIARCGKKRVADAKWQGGRSIALLKDRTTNDDMDQSIPDCMLCDHSPTTAILA